MNGEDPFDRQSAGFNRLTVRSFPFMSPNDLQAVGADLELSLPLSALVRCQHYFRVRERRDPTVGEMRFLGAVAGLWHALPRSIRVGDLGAGEEEMRIWRDVCRKRAELCEDAPPTFADVMDLAPRYLARAGFVPQDKRLWCGGKAEIAAFSGGRAPDLSLTVGELCAAVSDRAAPAAVSGALLLLFPTGNAPFDEEIRAFFAAHAALSLSPLALPAAEGVLPHLLALNGLMLDTAAIRGFDVVKGPAGLADIGRGALLFLAPETALSALFQSGAPLSLIGTANRSGRMQVRHGMENTLSLDLAFIRTMQIDRSVALAPADPPEIAPSTPVFTETAAKLLGGAACAGHAEQAVLTLAFEAYRRGADLTRATLTAALEVPLGTTGADRALRLLFGWHRALSELTLPSAYHRLIPTTDAAPRLTVFLSAPRGPAREDAVKPRDFAEARVLFYGA